MLRCLLSGILLTAGLLIWSQKTPPVSKPFPARILLEKPASRPLSAAMERLYDLWNPHEDRANELCGNFKFSRLEGFSYENNTSRRGRGLTWGLSHINPDGGGSMNNSILARFDCDLSLDADRQEFKRNNLRLNEATYFQRGVKLPDSVRTAIEEVRVKIDRGTIMGQARLHK